jgi:hypothetical protein
MKGFYYLYIRFFFQSKLITKTIWVLNHFLTLECYRKLCNRLYWRKAQPGTMSYATRCWVIFISVLSAVWMAFFYDPTDPANLYSTSKRMSILSRFFHRMNRSLQEVLNYFGQIMPANQFWHLKPCRIVRNDGILSRQSQRTYLRISSFLI